MDEYFIKKQNEIAEKLMQKTPAEIADFLGMDNNLSTESAIRMFVASHIRGKQGVGMSFTTKQYIAKSLCTQS